MQRFLLPRTSLARHVCPFPILLPGKNTYFRGRLFPVIGGPTTLGFRIGFVPHLPRGDRVYKYPCRAQSVRHLVCCGELAPGLRPRAVGTVALSSQMQSSTPPSLHSTPSTRPALAFAFQSLHPSTISSRSC